MEYKEERVTIFNREKFSMGFVIKMMGLVLMAVSFPLVASSATSGQEANKAQEIKKIKEITAAQITDDQNVGCGAGKYVMKDPTIFSLTMRATTNQSFSSQLFGITSGTCGCRKHDIVQSIEDRRQIFWALHQEDILVEISEYRRERPYLETYLSLGGKI